MSKTLKINGGTVVPVSNVRRIKAIDDAERAKVAERYDIEADAFNIQIEFADKSTKLARETLDQVRAQGIGLVNIGGDRFVPADNIKSADLLSKEDIAKMTEKGLTLSQTFRSRVETTAGTLLSSATPAQVIERAEKAKATTTAGQGAKATAAAPKA